MRMARGVCPGGVGPRYREGMGMGLWGAVGSVLLYLALAADL